MGMLMITCPTTKKPVHTGFLMDKKSFETATLTNNSVSCSACGKTHTWSKKDAYVAS